jgi:glyoxylase-like metal-dependent hydrolase (beta-lactamase superfamily II)
MSSAQSHKVGPGVGAIVGCHLYLLDSTDGVIAFDGGIKGAGPVILEAAGGAISRVVLSHSHVDHRGGAGELGAPIFCHPAEVKDAEGDGGRAHANFDSFHSQMVREGLPQLHAAWDSGPVKISGTVERGEDVAGFEVIHVPGHAPGQIALFRRTDRLLLAADTIYTLDAETGERTAARVPHPALNWNTAMARTAVRSLIQLDPATVWTGHAGHLMGDVARQLEEAAEYAYA